MRGRKTSYRDLKIFLREAENGYILYIRTSFFGRNTRVTGKRLEDLFAADVVTAIRKEVGE